MRNEKQRRMRMVWLFFLAVILILGVVGFSYWQIYSLSGNADSPDIGKMDMSSISDSSASYLIAGKDGDDDIYGKKIDYGKSKLELDNCRIEDYSTGVMYVDELCALIKSGKMDEVMEHLDMARISADGKEHFAETFLMELKDALDDGCSMYPTDEIVFQGGIIVTGMILRVKEGTVCGRLYDYEHAKQIAYTFFPCDGDSENWRFVPYSEM